MSVIATRNDFFTPTAKELKRKCVPAPELGEDRVVIMRSMTGRELTAWQQSSYKQRGKKGAKFDLIDNDAKVVVTCAIDEQGTNLFDESDIEWLSVNLGSALLSRLAKEAKVLSGIEEPEDGDDEAKKLPSTTKSESGGASPNGSESPSTKPATE